MKSFNSVPVAHGAHDQSSGMHVIQTSKFGQSITRVKGRQILGQVQTGVLGMERGGKLYVSPISPGMLGGRLALLAHEYEQQKMLKVSVVYAPSVPTLTPGSIALTYAADDAVPLWPSGEESLQQASTHSAFLDTEVWEEARLELDPDDITKSFFTEPGADARLEAQGIFYVVATSTLPAATTSYGNLYIDFECEFQVPQLDTEIEPVNDGTITLQWASYFSTQTAPQIFWSGASFPNWSAALALTGSVSIANRLFFGYIESITGTPAPWCSSSVDTGAFVKGGAYWLRSKDSQDTTLQTAMIAFTTFEGAMQTAIFTAPAGGPGAGEAANDQLCYSNAGPHTGTVTFRVRAVHFIDV